MMERTNPNLQAHFFVATLGLAEKINAKQPHGIKTIIDLIRCRAALSPLEPAVAMAQPDPGKPIVYTYTELLRAVSAWCERLSGYLPPAVEVGNTGSGPVVGLLSENSWDLMMCFFALIRMGYTVLLIAPQCDAPAVRHLLVETSATLLIASQRYFDLGTASTTASSGPAPCDCRILPNSEAADVAFQHNWWPTPKFITSSSISHIHHTSGTTSGLPKPIPQPHSVSTVHLPCLPPNPMVATFTTTPLYHGGVSDLFRSFMSKSLIWLYPGNLPVTADNIVKLIETANSATKVPVKLFTGVPWVQRECSESPSALEVLRKMDMVGFGGASMPEDVGYKLVRNGVKLVSRFGSTEMGFLMSSYRDFARDTAYDYLRIPHDEDRLMFERQSDGDYELVVRKDWPFMAKHNRPDGSWATSDLFVPNPNAPKTCFKYLTRNDSTIVLMNGKKFNPMVVEDNLRALTSVEEAIVFGQNKEYPGVFVFLSKKEILGGTKSAMTEIMNKMNEINKELPNYAKIARELVLVFSSHSGWPKNSKGMPLRGMAEKKYATVIETARQKYEKGIQNSQDATRISIEDPILLQERLSKIVSTTMGRNIDETEDFFSAGVDSATATTIRRKILGEVKVKSPLPMNVVFEQRNIAGLVDFLTSDRHTDEKHEAELKEMRRLVDQINISRRSTPPLEAQVVVLTGATGALGAHILSTLIKSGVRTIYCLVRRIGNVSSETRVIRSLKARKLDTWDSKVVKVQALHADFHIDYLGMNMDVYEFITKQATTIIHCAWPVNFLVPFGSFDHSIHGVENLLRLANSERRKRFIFCSSTASVIQTKGTIREELSNNPKDANPLGYSRSKWVAENIVKQMGGDVIRLGQLSGDTQAGIWNSDEGWPLILKTVGIVGSLPVLNERIEWLPVDIAARAVVNIAMSPQGIHGSGVWHVLNKCPVMWSDVLDAMEMYCGKFNRVEPKEWLRQLEEEEKKGAAIKLLSFWKDTYGSKTEAEETPESPDFEVMNTSKVYPGFEKGFSLGPDYLSRVFASLGVQRREPMLPN